MKERGRKRAGEKAVCVCVERDEEMLAVEREMKKRDESFQNYKKKEVCI